MVSTTMWRLRPAVFFPLCGGRHNGNDAGWAVMPAMTLVGRVGAGQKRWRSRATRHNSHKASRKASSESGTLYRVGRTAEGAVRASARSFKTMSAWM